MVPAASGYLEAEAGFQLSVDPGPLWDHGGHLPDARSRTSLRASLVAQWLRICLLMQGTRVRALVWEDPTCHGAAGPVSHNC